MTTKWLSCTALATLAAFSALGVTAALADDPTAGIDAKSFAPANIISPSQAGDTASDPKLAWLSDEECAAAKAKGHPWDVAKGFDASAPISALRAVSEIGHPRAARLRLTVNGELRQEGDIADMLFGVADIVRELSKLFTLMPGDLVYTGTPAGVAALQRGDAFVATLDGVGECRGRIV